MELVRSSLGYEAVGTEAEMHNLVNRWVEMGGDYLDILSLGNERWCVPLGQYPRETREKLLSVFDEAKLQEVH